MCACSHSSTRDVGRMLQLCCRRCALQQLQAICTCNSAADDCTACIMLHSQLFGQAVDCQC